MPRARQDCPKPSYFVDQVHKPHSIQTGDFNKIRSPYGWTWCKHAEGFYFVQPKGAHFADFEIWTDDTIKSWRGESGADEEDSKPCVLHPFPLLYKSIQAGEYISIFVQKQELPENTAGQSHETEDLKHEGRNQEVESPKAILGTSQEEGQEARGINEDAHDQTEEAKPEDEHTSHEKVADQSDEMKPLKRKAEDLEVETPRVAPEKKAEKEMMSPMMEQKRYSPRMDILNR